MVRRERMWQSFTRSFTLPDNAASEGMIATLDKGVLYVTVCVLGGGGGGGLCVLWVSTCHCFQSPCCIVHCCTSAVS